LPPEVTESQSPFAAHDRVRDFQGAGAAGGDTITIAENDAVVFHGEQAIDPSLGAALPGGGNGLDDLAYTIRRGKTWLINDSNDNGRLDGTDFAVAFDGVHRFVRDDFSGMRFITAGTEGDDILIGTAGDDTMLGFAGNDEMQALDGNDFLDGGAGDDLMDGGGGSNVLTGGDGNDRLSVQAGENGHDVRGGNGDDVLISSDNAFSFGVMDGEAGDDQLFGGAGQDLLFGGDGSDSMVSGGGSNRFIGGEGADVFVFGARWAAAGGVFQQEIGDFEDGIDKLDLRDSALQFADLTIENAGFFARITSTAGEILIGGRGGQTIQITTDDFLL
jgi:Ca2+-binding RTX toxin-like protein